MEHKNIHEIGVSEGETKFNKISFKEWFWGIFQNQLNNLGINSICTAIAKEDWKQYRLYWSYWNPNKYERHPYEENKRSKIRLKANFSIKKLNL